MIKHFHNHHLHKFHHHSLPPLLHSLSSFSTKPNPTNWKTTTTTTHTYIKQTPLLTLLETCTSMTHLAQIQAQMITSGLILDGFSSSRLVAFCAMSPHGDLTYCERILHFLKYPNVFSWNIVIRGYLESELPSKGLILYREMLRKGGIRPDNYSFPLLFKACARLKFVYMGHEIVGHVLKMGFESDLYVFNGILSMLVCCGRLDFARQLFDRRPRAVRDLVSWNSLINGYVHSGRGREAVRVYDEMRVEGVEPDEVTMIGMVSSCAQLGDVGRGREFHRFVEDHGLSFTVPLCNALMDMYVKCGDLEAAKTIFDGMKKRTSVSWTTMVVGYAKFGMLDEARRFFDEMSEKEVVPWNAMIGAYVQAKCGEEALALFQEMQGTNVRPDEVTMVHCLSACSQLGAFDVGIWIHHYIEKKKLSLTAALGTALVDMYAKCGNIGKALQVFHELPVRNSLTWTSIIGGLAFHGHASDALLYFSKMVNSGLVPDEVTFLGVLAACCHGGLIDEGRKYFAEMTSKYNLIPQIKHYSCMVDLLGRAGHLQEAEALISSMPMEPDAAVWGALFFACHMHGDIILGEKAAQKLLELDPNDSGIYVLLANMYKNADMWDEAKKARSMMKEMGVEKTPGCSSIEVDGVVNEFIIRDRSHPESEQIYECLAQLMMQLRRLKVESFSGIKSSWTAAFV